MSTPLYKFLKKSGFSTYAFASSVEDVSTVNQNDNYKMNFSKFSLLNLDLSKMDLDNPDIFNTESLNTITDKGELLISSLRNYTANHETTIRESLLNNNQSFYDSNELNTTTERIFWKWLRKSGLMELEPAVPNDEYIESVEFSVDGNLQNDYFKEYLWKERDSFAYNITNIEDESISLPDPSDNDIVKSVYKITLGSTTNIKPNDKIKIKTTGNINIGFDEEKEVTVKSVSTNNEPPNEGSRNNVVSIFSDVPLIWNNFATATIELVYSKVVKYIGEISSVNNVENRNKKYTEVNAYIPDHTGETPDILFRLKSDRNYSSGLQYPILASQDQPEIIGGEQFESPINTSPQNYPGDQYAYFDVDQKYVNSSGSNDRRIGEYFGVYENNRNNERVAQAPYVYPEFNGDKLDGVAVDFDPLHYTKMNIPTFKTSSFDDFNAKSFNDEAPKDFEFNAILWYYEVEDISLSPKNNSDDIVQNQSDVPNNDKHKTNNLYAITFVNPVVNGEMETYKKLVSNGEQDGLSYQFNLNLNIKIDNGNDQVIEKYDSEKVNSLFGFELYNEVMRRIAKTNDIFLDLAQNTTVFAQDLQNIKQLLYSQTDIRDINFRIESLYKLLDLYKTNQLVDSDSIRIETDTSTNPPRLKLNSIDSRYGNIVQMPVSLLYNNQDNTVLNNKITVPSGKDFLVNVINDDTSDVILDNNLNIILDRDLDYKQTCEFKIYPNNSRYNKKLNISINSSLIDGLDTIKGESLISNLDLPIDNNLNPNFELESINNRWDSFEQNVVPKNIGIRKISDNYFLAIELDSIQINSYKSGDVIFLNNFEFEFTNSNNVLFNSNIIGQYQIIGEIENNEIVVQIKKESFSDLYNEVNVIEVKPTHYFSEGTYKLAQAPFISYNTGWFISITCNDRDATNIKDKYLIEINNGNYER